MKNLPSEEERDNDAVSDASCPGLFAVRCALGLTRSQLARLAEVSGEYIRQLETTPRKYKPETLERLAEACCCDVSILTLPSLSISAETIWKARVKFTMRTLENLLFAGRNITGAQSILPPFPCL